MNSQQLLPAPARPADPAPSESLLRVAARMASLGAWSVELPSLRVRWSDNVRKILETDPDHEPEFTDFDFCAPECRTALREAFWRAATQGLDYDLELEVVTAKGHRKWVRAVGEALRNARGEIVQVQGAFQDISREKRLVSENEQLAGTLLSALESMRDGFVTLDQQWRLTYMNPRAEELLGCNRTEALGERLSAVLPDLRGCLAGAGEKLASGCSVEREAYCAPRGIWVQVRIHSAPTGMAVHLHDVTQARVAMQQERMHATRLSDMLNRLTDGLALINSDWEITYVNPAAEAMVKMTRQTMVGRKLMELFPDVAETPFMVAYRGAMEQRTTHEAEAFYKPLDVWLRVRAFPTQEGIAVCVTDTTAAHAAQKEVLRLHAELEQRVAERTTELQVARGFLEQGFESMPDCVFVKDVRELRFIRVNRAFEQLVGISRERIVGRLTEEVFPLDAQYCLAEDRRTLQDGSAEPYEVSLHTAHGVRRLHVRKAVIYGNNGTPHYLLAIATDVTEAREREREILRLNAELAQRTADADAASRAKSVFLATMSHEIRTPMNGVLGMLELLGLTRLDADQRSTLEVIRQSSGSLLRILDDVLDFSKIEADQLEICPEPGTLLQVLREVQQTFGSAAQRKGLKLRILADPDIRPVLRFDPLRVRQILGNFVSNAIKFTETGSVEITAEVVSRTREHEEVRLAVRDTGIGISEENQRQLFQPFSQGDTEAARRAGGAGLGLSICRRLAQMMGGSVELVSALGQGTTSTLTLKLPVASPQEREQIERLHHLLDAPAESARAPSDPAAVQSKLQEAFELPAQNRLILVVDDHPTNRMLLQRQVRTLGYAAESVENGALALEKWRSGHFALVITDCEMPGMSGYELAEAIRQVEAEQGLPRTPILACTAHALAGEAEKCSAAGMDDCLVKPVNLQRLQARLQAWLPVDTEPTQDDVLDAAPLDLTLLGATWGEDGAAVTELLGCFARSNTEDAAALRDGVARQDAAAVARASHRMMGASRMVGAHALATACEPINRGARAARWGAVQAAMSAFEIELDRVRAWIERGAAGAAAGALRPIGDRSAAQ